MCRFFYLLLILVAGSIPSTYAGGIHNLSDDLRALLRAEMNEISVGMHELFDAYYAGDMSEVSKIARNIESTFVLKKKLTESQKKALHSVLPDGFLKQDRQFHYNAGMLAHAADERKEELVEFYYSELLKGCLSCHSTYANERFGHFKHHRKTQGGHNH